MAEIVYESTDKAHSERVFQAFATPGGLDKWWTKTSTGDSCEGGSIEASVSKECHANSAL
jgi:uncharacterized protein YndB with AHSA1/START domain